MKVGHRIRLLGAMATTAMLALVIIITFNTRAVQKEVANLSDNVVPTYQDLLVLQHNFLNARRELLMHLLENDPARMASIKAETDRYIAGVDTALATYSQMIADNTDRELYEKTRNAAEGWKGALDTFFTASTAGRKDEALRLVQNVTSHRAAEVIEGIDKMSKHYEDVSRRSQTRVGETFSSLSTISIGTSAVLLIALFLLCEYITRGITRPLNALRDLVASVAKDFDFTRRATGIGNDEVGQTQQSLNTLLQTMQESLRQVFEIGHAVGQRAEDVATASSELSAASHMVSESSERMASNTEQVTVSVAHVAERATEADARAHEAGEHAASGGHVIEDTIERINRIANYVRESSQQIENLVQRTESIGVVVSTIREIADQTNLLALNAAIEAARAGETGRGFAVVADEVRKLAERTSGSTREISSTVCSIQHEAEQTVVAMKNTVTEVEHGVHHAEEALTAITRIRQSADEVKLQVEDITKAMHEQSAASTGMAQEVERVAQMAEETSVTAARTADSSTELNTLAQDLNRVIASYKI